MAQKSKMLTAIALILLMTAAFQSSSQSIANAHTPSWTIKTWALLSVSPTTVGVGQQVEVYMWLSIQPPTALGAYGDRWHGYTLKITKPDNTTEIKGPFSSDPIGFAWTLYIPDQVGAYTFQFSFPGQNLTGENLNPNDKTGQEYIGDYFEPSTSNIASIKVQQNAVPTYPETPLPTEYWTRPIYPENREWWPISGNWLESPPARNDLQFAPYTTGPEAPHILWTKPLSQGGLVGGEFGETSYYSGNAYEGQWFPPVIINGKLYYNKYPSDIYYGSSDGGPQYPRAAPKPGFYCVELRTGEVLWYNNETRIDFGQIYRYDSPNQHGAMAYLWAINGTTWKAYDAFSGDWVYTIQNVPSGTQASGSDGSILRYQLNTAGHWLALWNSSAIPELLGGPTGTQNWQWRPYGKTVDGRKGYVWNVSIPADIQGTINFVFADRILGSNGLGQTGRLNLGTKNFTIWCLSLKPGEEGRVLWKKDYTSTAGVTLSMEAASLSDNIFTLWGAESRQHWGYSLSTGEPLWGPTQSQDAWDYTVGTKGAIVYGRLFTYGYSGIIYCYNVTNGKLLWTWEAKDDYYGDAKWGGRYLLDIAFIADGKIYTVSGEHSPDDPKERGAPMAAIDIETGKELWKIPFYSPHWSNNPVIADGIIVYQNIYDNQIYAIGKGPSATTVTASPKVTAKGSSVLIEGTVADVCAGAKKLVQEGKFTFVPAVADEYMGAWMEYLYMQKPIPGDAKGVSVKLAAVASDGTVIDIGTVTSDMSGMFKKLWAPPAEGEYTVIATFEGSESYWPSYAETAVGVTAALAPSVQPSASPSASVGPSVSPSVAPPAVSAPSVNVYVVVAAVVVVVAVVAAVALMLRKKRQ
jgi:outer membrane protein assembly factor BamB